MMHTYAGLALLTMMVAYSVDSYGTVIKPLAISFALFLLTAIIIDIHLWNESMKSGLVGKRMAQEAIQKTRKPVNSVYVIIIKDDYPKLSSFCVIPNEAFGWGLASKYETNYQWPKSIQDTTIECSLIAKKEAERIGKEVLNKNLYDCVWIVNHTEVSVINKY